VFRQIGAPEIILILAVVVLLFGAKKLPELARGSGRALRIFKAETKGLIDDDDETATPEAPKAITPTEAAPTQAPTAEVPPAERRTDQAD
jgi:sec-independent protein translocase protein TatA